jgi:hypothetical protein
MLPQSLNKGSSRGQYKQLDEDENMREEEDQRRNNIANPVSEVSFTWFYMMLSAFGGFVVAIVLVNIFPGNLAGETSVSYGNAKLDKLLKCDLLLRYSISLRTDSG